MLKGKKKKSEGAKETSEPDSYMIQILKLSDRELIIPMINMLRNLMEKQTTFKVGNISRETKTNKK